MRKPLLESILMHSLLYTFNVEYYVLICFWVSNNNVCDIKLYEKRNILKDTSAVQVLT